MKRKLYRWLCIITVQDSFNVKLLIHPGNSSATFPLFSKENALSQPYFPTNFPAHSPAHRGVSLFRSDGEITRSLRGIIINLVKPPDNDAVPIDNGTSEICPKTLLLLLRNRTRQRYVTGVRTPVSFVTSLDDVIELTMRKLRYNFWSKILLIGKVW